MINSSNGTSHIYDLKKPKKINETHIHKLNQKSEQKIVSLVPKTRFKYKSMMKQGELKIVSIVNRKDCIKTQSGKEGYVYRVLTYTSKNEFFVIDIKKNIRGGNSMPSLVFEDEGISTVDLEEEKAVNDTQGVVRNAFKLNTLETFQLNIAD